MMTKEELTRVRAYWRELPKHPLSDLAAHDIKSLLSHIEEQEKEIEKENERLRARVKGMDGALKNALAWLYHHRKPSPSEIAHIQAAQYDGECYTIPAKEAASRCEHVWFQGLRGEFGCGKCGTPKVIHTDKPALVAETVENSPAFLALTKKLEEVKDVLNEEKKCSIEYRRQWIAAEEKYLKTLSQLQEAQSEKCNHHWKDRQDQADICEICGVEYITSDKTPSPAKEEEEKGEL